MKRIVLLAVLLLSSHHLMAQTQPYHVVFDVTSADSMVHQRVIRMINLIISTNPDAKIEVVYYGMSLNMIVKEKSTVSKAVQQLAADKKASFVVCEQAMQVHKIERGQLITGVTTVPDGIYELIKKQAEGYGYIKVSY